MSGATDAFDLTDPAHQQRLLTLSDALLADPTIEPRHVATRAGAEAPLEFRLAAKLYDSRRFLRSVAEPVRIGVVFAMWGEQARLLPRTDANPNGEDSLATKVRQLAWATADTPVEWTLYAVDDGCPFDSGGLAAEIAQRTPGGEGVRVLRLAEHVPATDGPLRGLGSEHDSRKGGSIILGAAQALADGMDAVVYTDADNSVHLGQLGLVLRPLLDDGIRAVLGDRQHPESVLVKDAARWGIGIKNLRHMQRMAGQEIFGRGIGDTQAAFKLFQRDLLAQILESPVVYDFSFDTDWIAAFIARDEPYAQVPFAFIDSDAESATAKQQPMTTWEALLKGLVAALRHHDLLRTPESRAMADVIDEEIESFRDLNAIIDDLPPQLVDAEPADFGDPNVMTPGELRDWIRGRKATVAAEVAAETAAARGDDEPAP